MTTNYTVDRETWEAFWDELFFAAMNAAVEYGLDVPTEGMFVGEDGLEMIIDEDAFTDDQFEDDQFEDVTFEDETFETDTDYGFDSTEVQLESEGMDTEISSDTSLWDIDDPSTNTDNYYDDYYPTGVDLDVHTPDMQSDYNRDNHDFHDGGFDDNTDG